MKEKQFRPKYLIVLTAILFSAGICCILFRIHGSITVSAAHDTPEVAAAFFTQKDPAWAQDSLGRSKFTMSSSGCLTTCIASALVMEKIVNCDPGTLNSLFSSQNVYNSEGDIQWEQLEKTLGITVTRKSAAQTGSTELEDLLNAGIFPIVRVRRNGIGSFHYVLVIKSENCQFWCMDPLHPNNELVPLSGFGNRIYAVRTLSLL